MLIAVIGIDDYEEWPRLSNAANDARGALATFASLGFEPAVPPLLDRAATAAALEGLVTDDLAGLGEDDSLVVFFAGHGHTISHVAGGALVKTGYIIPVDGDQPGGSRRDWIKLDNWLSNLALLPPRHILVILDACRAGIALGNGVVKWRDAGIPNDPLDELKRRRSRRVITSALDDQKARDGGPIPGHSLFTGCLLEGLQRDLARGGRPYTTGSELGLYLQKQVSRYGEPRQTPDFGTLELDDRGELVMPVLGAVAEPNREIVPDHDAHRSTRSEAAESDLHRGRSGVIAIIGAVLVAATLASLVLTRQCGHHAPAKSDGPVESPRQIDAVPAAPLSLAERVEAANPWSQIQGIRVQSHLVTREEYALFSAPPGEGSPQTHVQPSYQQAFAFCRAIDARIPNAEDCGAIRIANKETWNGWMVWGMANDAGYSAACRADDVIRIDSSGQPGEVGVQCVK